MYPKNPAHVVEAAYKELNVDPHHETPMTTIRGRDFAIRYLYSRSSESQTANVLGQDTLRFRYSDNKIVFAVCDGVGQSFNGQLASQFLGDNLVKWLWGLPDETLFDERAFPIRIREYLNNLTE
jgi:serine/threonine protein phosphatase PrpC